MPRERTKFTCLPPNTQPTGQLQPTSSSSNTIRVSPEVDSINDYLAMTTPQGNAPQGLLVELRMQQFEELRKSKIVDGKQAIDVRVPAVAPSEPNSSIDDMLMDIYNMVTAECATIPTYRNQHEGASNSISANTASLQRQQAVDRLNPLFLGSSMHASSNMAAPPIQQAPVPQKRSYVRTKPLPNAPRTPKGPKANIPKKRKLTGQKQDESSFPKVPALSAPPPVATSPSEPQKKMTEKEEIVLTMAKYISNLHNIKLVFYNDYPASMRPFIQSWLNMSEGGVIIQPVAYKAMENFVQFRRSSVTAGFTFDKFNILNGLINFMPFSNRNMGVISNDVIGEVSRRVPNIRLISVYFGELLTENIIQLTEKEFENWMAQIIHNTRQARNNMHQRLQIVQTTGKENTESLCKRVFCCEQTGYYLPKNLQSELAVFKHTIIPMEGPVGLPKGLMDAVGKMIEADPMFDVPSGIDDNTYEMRKYPSKDMVRVFNLCTSLTYQVCGVLPLSPEEKLDEFETLAAAARLYHAETNYLFLQENHLLHQSPQNRFVGNNIFYTGNAQHAARFNLPTIFKRPPIYLSFKKMLRTGENTTQGDVVDEKMEDMLALQALARYFQTPTENGIQIDFMKAAQKLRKLCNNTSIRNLFCNPTYAQASKGHADYIHLEIIALIHYLQVYRVLYYNIHLGHAIEL